MIASTTIQQPERIATEVTARGNSVVVGNPSVSIEVTQVTQGLTGSPGSTTPGSGDRTHTHNQSPASDLWVINHNLSKYPSVDVFDSAGDQVEGDVRHIDENSLRITFTAPFSGVAYLN